MSAISLAVIGKGNEPLYLRDFCENVMRDDWESDKELFGLSVVSSSATTAMSTLPVNPLDGAATTSTTTTTTPHRAKRTHTTSSSSSSSSSGGGGCAVQCSLRQQFILHAACDRFDQLAGPHQGFAWRSPGASGSDAMFVGLLCPIEDMRVYGM
jgi:hypothetical protein